MIRVLLLTHVFPRAVGDPLGAFLLHLAQALSAPISDSFSDAAASQEKSAGAQLFVVAPHAKGLQEQEDLGGINVTRFRYAAEDEETLAYTGVMHEQVARGMGGKVLFGRFVGSYVRAARAAIHACKPHVIHAHWWLPGGLVGALVSRQTGTPLVITTHGTDVEQLSRTGWASPLARFTFGRARVVTCGSNYQREQLIALGVADPRRLRVIPMPVNPIFVHREAPIADRESPIANLAPEPLPHANPTSSQRFQILTVSRLTRQKSVDTLLDALALVRVWGVDAHLRIVGDGDQRAALEQKTRAARLEPFVEFLGMRAQAELPEFYADCDVFVMPSVREGMGLVLAEALLCGAPVIATNSGGVPDIVRDGKTGLLFPERDANALAGALEHYARDPRLAARLAQAGRRHVLTRFAPARIAAQFLESYEAAIRR